VAFVSFHTRARTHTHTHIHTHTNTHTQASVGETSVTLPLLPSALPSLARVASPPKPPPPSRSAFLLRLKPTNLDLFDMSPHSDMSPQRDTHTHTGGSIVRPRGLLFCHRVSLVFFFCAPFIFALFFLSEKKGPFIFALFFLAHTHAHAHTRTHVRARASAPRAHKHAHSELERTNMP
jgi:hypothetical protein